MSNPNFLILDEPTNDFDIFTMNILEQFLYSYKGCLLIVSHDRYFMDKVADTLFILEEDGTISGFVGKCSEYIEYRKQKKQEELKAIKEEKAATYKKEADSAKEENTSKKKKRSFKEQKEFEELEVQILELEEEKSSLEEKLSGGNSGTDFSDIAEITKQYQDISDSLEKKYARWEELASIE